MTHLRCTMFGSFFVSAALALGGATVARGQVATVRGTVTDSSTHVPITGADVAVVGSGVITVTRANGQYVLDRIKPGTITIRARVIGYAPSDQTITLTDGADQVVDFVLAARPIELAPVAVGYGTQARNELSSSVSSVGSEDIAHQPVAGLDAALQGKAAGVQVTQNAGNPGNGISVRVRGSASISAGSQPLFVVDGVPINSSDISQLGLGGQGLSGVTGLSPDDIESIEVLKDAASTSIYGSRGSNGVVMITTKRGESGKAQVSFDAYTGTQAASKRLSLLNSPQYLQFFNEAAFNDGYGSNYFGVAGVDDQVNTDWQSAVLRHAPIGNAELAVSGGDDRVRYRVSGNFFDQSGIVAPSQYRRIGGRANVDFSASERLTFKTSLLVSGENDDRVAGDGSDVGIITNAVGNQPLFPVKRPDGTFTTPGSSFPDGLQYPNSAAIAAFFPTQARTTRILGDIEGHWRIGGGLGFTSRVGADLLNLRESQFQSRKVGGTYAASANGVAKSGYSVANRYVFDNFATLDRDLSASQRITLTAGSSIELNRSEFNFLRGEGFSNDNLTQVSNATTIVDGEATTARSSLVSFFSRANYALAGKYLLGASVRSDGSSRFGRNSRWGVFPSVSAAWVVSREPFFANNRLFNNLKIRSSYGVTGNQPLTDFLAISNFGTANYGDSSGLAQVSLTDPNLKWETTKQFDLGFDAALLRDRINLTVDYYHKNTSDLLLDRPVTGTSGFTSVFSNVGNLQNKGVEVAISTVNLNGSGSGLRWVTTLNVAANRNRVTKLFDNQPFTGGERDINRVEVGQPLGAFYALKFLGVDPATGDAIYQDTDGDGSITANDRVIVGSPHPKWTGGFTNAFNWKGLDLSFFLQFSRGNQIFNAMRLFSGAGGYYEDNQFTDAMRRWQKPGDITDVPRASFDGTSGARTVSSRFIEDGSYWRMQNVTLGYQLPGSFAGTVGFQRARLYISAQNLFTSSKFTGYNPDVNSNGNSATFQLGTDFYAYPLARTFMFGVQAGW
ncbi:MAG: TonB-dependent receptor [Gemmatimonadota bacterium]